MSTGYWGSKRRLAADIADVLCADGGTAYYEPFCGMASVGMEVLRRGCFARMTWSDKSEDVAVYWNGVRRGWLPSARPLPQAEWEKLKRSRRASPRRSFYGFDLGFGGQLLAGRSPVASMNREAHLARARERVRAAGALMRAAGARLVVERRDCAAVRVPRGAVVYCDPPYLAPPGKDLNKKHVDKAGMTEVWACLARWRDAGAAVYLSAASRPRPPRGLRVEVVRTWRILNRIQTAKRGSAQYRTEYLLRVI